MSYGNYSTSDYETLKNNLPFKISSDVTRQARNGITGGLYKEVIGMDTFTIVECNEEDGNFYSDNGLMFTAGEILSGKFYSLEPKVNGKIKRRKG